MEIIKNINRIEIIYTINKLIKVSFMINLNSLNDVDAKTF